jgi:hypothetical protein
VEIFYPCVVLIGFSGLTWLRLVKGKWTMTLNKNNFEKMMADDSGKVDLHGWVVGSKWTTCSEKYDICVMDDLDQEEALKVTVMGKMPSFAFPLRCHLRCVHFETKLWAYGKGWPGTP